MDNDSPGKTEDKLVRRITMEFDITVILQIFVSEYAILISKKLGPVISVI